MTLAVMQPYFFPYLGYFQLARSVEHFVFLDDVAFIKRGFIQRNRILLNGVPFQFSVAVRQASQNRAINEHEFVGDFSVFHQQLRHAYARAPYFTEVFALVEALCHDHELNVAHKAAASVCLVFDYLGLPLQSSFASELALGELAGETRILAICRQMQAQAYHNAIGGRSLYDGHHFTEQGVQLRFVEPHLAAYPQAGGEFVAGLSILDVLMYNAPQDVCRMLDDYRLLPASS
ncbi:WbqC family protein [Pseudomonas sp.]|uniref:WbqC family protein n=1 Tax=Pseudomonas sp. TaxID=306 RepID=UPI002C5032EE|nr:WbqC family protein [Pseudomonas sp.]HUE91246.1 WbqC family protein [Pseudomonas sp.]